jgi:hypothetical protein
MYSKESILLQNSRFVFYVLMCNQSLEMLVSCASYSSWATFNVLQSHNSLWFITAAILHVIL